MANVFDEAEAQIKTRSVFDVASEELSREEKAKERRAEGEQLLKRFEPVESPYDDPMAIYGMRAGHALTKAALLSGGKKTDVALGVLGPLAATAASTLVPVPGSTVAAGAGSSGAADALVQAREYFRGERDELSKGRLLASTALGAVVPPSVKAAATPFGTAVKTVATRGAQGAGLGAAHEAISEAVDEGKLSAKGIITAGVLGTLFGAGFGTLEGAAPHILKLLRGKTVEEAKKVIAEELPKLDTDAAMDAATKAEVRGLLEGAQKRIDDALGIKPETAAPTEGNTTIGRQAAAEKAFGGEAPLTRIEKADERAAALTAARAEEVRQTLLARQAGAPETTVLTGDEAQNQLTKLETRPGEARRERARLLARQEAQPEVGGVVPANVETSPQAERVLAREGFEGAPLAPQVARPTPIADLKKRVDAVRPESPIAPSQTAQPEPVLPPTKEAKPNAEVITSPVERDAPKSKRIGLPADGEMDILNHVQELGGIRHPDNVQEGSRKGGEYDGFAGLWEGGGLPRALVRRDGGGSTPDQLVGELRANGVPVKDSDHLFELIEKARKERPKKRADVATQNYVSRFETAFLGDAEKIAQMQREGKGITVDDLRVGDTFTVNKEKFRVTGIDENGFVTVKDGITRTVEPGTPIFPDKDKINRAGKKVPDFVTPADEAAASTATEPKVTRAENFATDGNYNVEFPDGKKGQVYRDPENGWWYETGDSGKGGTPPLPVGFNKAEAIEGLRARIDKRAEKPFSLASATNEQQAAEAAANRERLLAQERAQKIQTLAEKPLTGDSSDVGQGTLLAGDEDLFSGPSAETLAKRDPKQAGFIDRRLLFSTPLQSALGGIAGGIYGSKQGDTSDERAQNMLLYGAAGAGVGAASRIIGRAALNRLNAKATYEIDKHLAPPPGKTIVEKLSEAPTNVKAATLSVYAPLDKLEDDVRKAASWLYVLPKRELPLSREFEQVAGATGKGGQDVRDYVRNVLDPVGEKDRQNFDRLVALKRIEQRLAWNDANASDRKVVGDWTHAKVAADLAKLESDIGAKRVGELDAIASGIMQQEADDALRLQVESGRLSQEAYNQIKADNDFYAPFKVLDHLEGYDTGGGRAVDTRDQLAKVIQGIHSTDFHIENPSVALAQHIFKGRVLAEKNLKMQELAKLADNDVSGSLIRKLGPDDEVRRGYEAVNYFDNGKPMRLEVRPEIAEAVKGLNVTESGLLANFARQAGGLFRFGATTGNLAFQPVNFALADQPNLWLVSKYGLRGAEDIARAPVDFAHGLYASIFSNLLGGEGGTFAKVGANVPGLKQANAAAGKLAREFHESGATGSNWQELVDTMGGTVDEKKFAQSLKLGEHSLLDSIGSINKAIEESTKMMGFKRGVRVEGLDKMKPADAAQALKKVVTEVRNYAGSPDFMRSGYATRDLNNLVQMFLNARVQGITNLTGRLAGADGVEAARNAWLRIAGTIGVGAAYVWYQNHRPENEADYRSRSETERKNYFLFPRYDDKGAPLYSTNEFGQNVREYWRLPKREVLQYMGNTVESALDFAHEKDPEAVSKYVTQMAENLSPVNISGKTGRERMESIVGGANPLVKVPYEQLSGRDTFRHRDILPTDDLKRASPENQFVETTPKLFVNAADAMPDFAPDNLRSPMLLQNLVEGVSGRAVTQFLPRKQPEGRDPTAASVASNPLTSRFAGSLYVDRSAEQAEIDKVKQGEADIRVEQRRAARQTISDLKKLSPEEVTARLTDIAENRPKLFEAIMSEAKKNDRDVIDRQLLGLGVKNGARAQFIVGQLRKMDPEKAADYLSRLSEGDGAPLTPEVFEQVALLLQVQPQAAPAPASLTPEANQPVSDGIPTMTVQEAFKAPPGKLRGTNGKTYIKQANGQIIESK